jgi:hypothetical protein
VNLKTSKMPVLTPVILATQEADQDQASRFEVWEILSRKNPSQKRAGGVAQGVGPEFKSQHLKKIPKENLNFDQEPIMYFCLSH